MGANLNRFDVAGFSKDQGTPHRAHSLITAAENNANITPSFSASRALAMIRLSRTVEHVPPTVIVALQMSNMNCQNS